MPRDPWLRLDTDAGTTLPRAGQPGHGRTAYLRRQPARIVDGRMEGGTPARSSSSAASAAIIPTWITPRSPAAAADSRAVHQGEGLAAYANHLGLGTGG